MTLSYMTMTFTFTFTIIYCKPNHDYHYQASLTIIRTYIIYHHHSPSFSIIHPCSPAHSPALRTPRPAGCHQVIHQAMPGGSGIRCHGLLLRVIPLATGERNHGVTGLSPATLLQRSLWLFSSIFQL